ncbi:hypothetical protein Tco_0016724 [Tanacetum coccineum]
MKAQAQGDYKFETESQEASLGDQEDASKQGRKINDIDKDAEITLVHETQERYGDEEMFDTGVLDDEEVLEEPEVTIKDVNLNVDEVTLAQALLALKSAKVQEIANVIEEPSESITTTPTLTTTTSATTITIVSTRPKAKGLVIHEEGQATTSNSFFSTTFIGQRTRQSQKDFVWLERTCEMKKGSINHFDEETCFQAYIAGLKRIKKKGLAREKAQREEEANIVAWDNVQEMIDVDYKMAQQMQVEEQEKLSIEEKSKLFVQLLEARNKHFVVMRTQEMRNKTPTKA